MKILPITSTNISVNSNQYCAHNNPVISALDCGKGSIPLSALKANFMPVFTSLMRKDAVSGTPLHSGFYRDIPTLLESAHYINQNFPQGTNIIVGACSTGEDLISLYSLLPEYSKHKFIGLDSSSDALKIADKNIYSVCEGFYDDYLIDKSEIPLSKPLKTCFYNVMERAESPDFLLNNVSPAEYVDVSELNPRYFRIKDLHRKNLSFDKFDMMNIDKYSKVQDAGAIFFRNVMYLLTGNYLNQAIYSNWKIHKDPVNREQILQTLVDSVYKKLSLGGIFVVGEIPADHVYIVDNFTPKNKRIQIDNVLMFDNDIDYNMVNPEIEIYKKSPLYSALEKGGRFKPIFSSTMQWGDYQEDIPTIWKKVK